ncbi:MAG: nuclear transport factor 2 family protein [Acidobacteria bacterium]|nr:nuclear transport factor 2 family protein [Acidobacteriota bacterium]
MKRTFLFAATIAVTMLLNLSAVNAQQEGAGAGKVSKQDMKKIAAIRAVLDAQTAAWNRGDIEGFMDGYARSPNIVFVSGDSLTHGWQTVLDRYKKGYDTREKMGTLAFSDLEINVISKDAAVVIGRWQLTRAGDTPKGRFTLIFRRKNENWRIVHDHTSSAS